MKRLPAAFLFVLGLLAAGAFSGAVIAESTTSTATTTAATTTGAATTTTAITTTTVTTTAPSPTTAPPPPPKKPKPPPKKPKPPRKVTIPHGVRVAGVRVGGLPPARAVAAVRAAFARPLTVVVDRSKLVLDPTKVASAYVATAVARARVAPAGTNVGLVVAIRGAPVRAWVAAIRDRFSRPAADASLQLRGDAPFITPEQVGRTVAAKALTRRVIAALRGNSRLPVRVHTKVVAPAITADLFAEVIVINRSLNRLYLYSTAKLWRTFPVATGQSIYPTPLGEWHIVVKYKNPWWYPPVQDDWAKGLKPVPPGPDNPLGTRWMGLDAPGVGIHGTDNPSSIGYSASHGCVRMQVPDSEWLFDHVDIGTTVFVV
ncbi:MAG: L,D-transpeptidase family protein [Gaiellaceae bacterium]